MVAKHGLCNSSLCGLSLGLQTLQMTNDLYFKVRRVKADRKLCKHGRYLTTDMFHSRATECPARLSKKSQVSGLQVFSLRQLDFLVKGSSSPLPGGEGS